jgi:D-inositol-3-phosphate glycosyltransferase
MSFAVAMLSVHTSPLDLPGKTKDAGGMNVYMRELAQALAQRDLKIDIYTRYTNKQLPQIVQMSPQVRVIHIQAGPLATIHKHDLYQYLPEFVSHLEQFRQQEALHYDVVHSHYWLSGLAALTLARLWNTPHVIMFHTLAYLKQLANPERPEPALRLAWEQKLAQQADGIIAATTDERRQIISYYGAAPEKVRVIPCGVDLQLFAPRNKHLARKCLNLSTEQPIVLFAGRLDPFKGPDLLLRAASKMKMPAQILLVGGNIAGEDQDLLKLRALARELRIAENVHFPGSQPQQELPWFYSASDVTVVPSYHETFGLTAVEALACGTPVVATRAGGLTTVVQHGQTGFLVPHTPEAFAEHIDAILLNPTLRSSMSMKSRDSVQLYSWHEVANNVHQLYEQLAGVPSLIAQ